MPVSKIQRKTCTRRAVAAEGDAVHRRRRRDRYWRDASLGQILRALVAEAPPALGVVHTWCFSLTGRGQYWRGLYMVDGDTEPITKGLVFPPLGQQTSPGADKVVHCNITEVTIISVNYG